MKLNSFENDITPRILERGKKYWNLGNVTFLEEVETDIWEASIEGSNTYEVDVSLSHGEITYSHCDCPYDGTYCKHEVAVYYAILEAQGKEKKQKKRAQKVPFKELVNQIDEQELRDFVADFAKKNKAFRTHLTAKFGLQSADPQEVRMHYSSMLQSFFRLYAEDGYITYNQVSRFSQQLDQVVEQAYVFLKKNDYKSSFIVAQVFMDEVIDMYAETDDSTGIVSESINSMFDFLERLVITISSEALKEQIFDYALREVWKSKYSNYDFERNWHSILTLLVKNAPIRAKLFFNSIDKELEQLNKQASGNWTNEYKKEVLSMLKQKLADLNKN